MWWKEIRLIIWGPSALLLSQADKLQADVSEIKANGIEVLACISCVNMYGVTPTLQKLNIPCLGMGEPLTKMLKGDWTVMTI